MKNIFVKKKFLDLILTGQKTVEVRVCYPSVKKLKAGQIILLNRRHFFEIKRIGQYKDFAEMLENENPNQIYPGKTKTELLKELRRLYSIDKEALGVMSIEVAAI